MGMFLAQALCIYLSLNIYISVVYCTLGHFTAVCKSIKPFDVVCIAFFVLFKSESFVLYTIKVNKYTKHWPASQTAIFVM